MGLLLQTMLSVNGVALEATDDKSVEGAAGAGWRQGDGLRDGGGVGVVGEWGVGLLLPLDCCTMRK